MLIVKTELGHRVMKDRSVTLTPRQRAAFILFDGKRTMQQVMSATQAVGVTKEDVDKLFELGLIEGGGPQAPAQPTPAGAPAAAAAEAGPAIDSAAQPQPRRTSQERFKDAYPIATALTAQLGLRGFRLNLAVEAAGSYEELLAVAPRIRDAVGPEKFRPLDAALNGD